MRRPRLTDANRRWWLLVTMTGALSMILIDATVVAVALPTIQQDLDVSQSSIQWIVNAYLLALASLVAVGGRLGDMIGHGRMFRIGAVIFIAASGSCGFAVDEPMLVVSRAIQGAGAAIMIPSTGAIVINAFAVSERGRAMGIYAGISMVFLALGPLVGGLFTELVSWRAVFWVNLPVGLAMLGLAHFTLPPTPGQPDARLDIAGLLTLVPSLTALVLALMEGSNWGWGSPATLALGIGGVVCLAAFVLVELRVAKQPLIDMRIFASSNFRVDALVLFCVQFVLMGMSVFGAIWIQNVLGFDPIAAGAALLPMMVMLVAVAPVSGRLYDRAGPRLLVGCGALAIGTGLGITALLLEQLSYAVLIPSYALTGLGIGFVMTPTNTDAMNSAPPDLRGQAAGVLQTVRQVGGTVGLAIMGAIVASVQSNQIDDFVASSASPAEAEQIERALAQTKDGGSLLDLPAQVSKAARDALTDAIHTAYLAGAGLLIVVAVIALVVLRRVAASDADPSAAAAAAVG